MGWRACQTNRSGKLACMRKKDLVRLEKKNTNRPVYVFIYLLLLKILSLGLYNACKVTIHSGVHPHNTDQIENSNLKPNKKNIL